MEVGHKNCTTIGTKCRVAKRVGHHLYDMKVLNVLWSPGSPATDWSHLAVPGTADTGQSGATTPPPLSQTRFVFCNSTWLNSIDLDCTNLL